MVAFTDDSGLTEGPAQVRIAELGAAQAFDFAGTGDGAFDQAAVREEVFDGGEALDVADLIEDVKPRLSPIPGTVCSKANSRQATFLVWRWSSSSSWKIC